MVSKSKKNESQSGLKIVVISTEFYKFPRRRFLACFELQNRPYKGPSIGINSNLALGCPSNTVFRPSLDKVYSKFRPSSYQVWTKFGPSLDHILAMRGPSLDQVWTKLGPGLDEVQTKFGPRLDQV